MKSTIAIVDYGMGNLRSVHKAFERCGAAVRVTDSPRQVAQADKIVLPGVGAFGAAVRELRSRDLWDAVLGRIRSGAPYLGLCLGLQLLFERSQESPDERGFAVVPGTVKRFTGSLKVPHMGWNTLKLSKKNCPLLKGIKNEDYFYFVHSYYADPKDTAWSAAKTHYGKNFCSVVWKDNVYATQFHPEKSQEQGLAIIRNFTEL